MKQSFNFDQRRVRENPFGHDLPADLPVSLVIKHKKSLHHFDDTTVDIKHVPSEEKEEGRNDR